MKVQLIVFDMDQTLVDSTTCICNATNYALEQIGKKPVAQEKIIPRIGLPVKKFLEVVAGLKEPGKINKVLKHYSHYFKKKALIECTLYPGVKETLEHFSKKEKKLAVSTTSRLENAVHILKGLGIINFFEVIIGEEMLQHVKPDPESLFLITEQLKVDPKQAVMVGDTYMDLEAGKSAGMHIIGILHGVDSKEDLEAVGPDAIIKNITELQTILE
jgi:phosphoglycolate phosphatase